MREFENVLFGVESSDGQTHVRDSFATGMRVHQSAGHAAGARVIRMKSYRLKKTGLNSLMVKRIVMSDLIHTEPYNLHTPDPEHITQEYTRQSLL